MADNNTPRQEDLVSVGTRVSWGAVLAGAVVALAFYLVLSMLGTAIGLSAAGTFRGATVVGWALAYAILSMGISLFAGGWVTSQLTAGETTCESMVHGVILWGTVVTIMLGMTAMGITAGFNAVLGTAYAAGSDRTLREDGWESAARDAGVSQEKIDEWKRTVREAKEEAKDPETQAKARRTAAAVTWAALFGTLLSMGAAIGGALCGAGPQGRIVPLYPRANRISPPAREYAGRV